MSYGQCVFKYMVIVEADVKDGDRTANLTFSTSITLYGLSPGVGYTVIVQTMADACHTNKSAAVKRFTVPINGEFIIIKLNIIIIMATSRCKVCVESVLVDW